MNGRPALLTAVLLAAALLAAARPDRARAEEFRKWETQTPAFARNAESWRALLAELDEREMNYGSVAAASRMLIFFNDLPTKEAAYRSIVRAVDLGIPLAPRDQFVTGDLDPRGDYGFSNSYYLYKALVNRARGLERWAGNHFAKIDRAAFPKFLFFEAVESYASGNRAKASELLEKILAKGSPEVSLSLLKKAARTLARIRFEEKDHEGSLEIYREFLLKTNPIEPNDWVEAAWNLYHLKRHDEALGMLYNSESKAAQGRVNLEKYMIRALIHRENCDSQKMVRLIETFDRDFGPMIHQIKTGENLMKIPNILRVLSRNAQGFEQTLSEYEGLKTEFGWIQKLPSGLRALADYLYRSQLTLVRARFERESEDASSEAARRIILLAENLRFLRFDVEKAKFDPSAVFVPSEPEDKPLLEAKGDSRFRISWPQVGDYWREERLSYTGRVVNRCGGR